MKKYSLLIAMSISNLFFSSCTCKRIVEDDRGEKWEFRIESMFIDKNHAVPTVVLSGNKQKNVQWGISDLPDLYRNASIGDSMCKDSGSLEVRLVKKDTTMYFYPNCAGEILK